MASWLFGGRSDKRDTTADATPAKTDIDDVIETTDSEDDEFVVVNDKKTATESNLATAKRDLESVQQELGSVRQQLDTNASLHKKELDCKDRYATSLQRRIEEYEKKLQQQKPDLEKLKVAIRAKEEESKSQEEKIRLLRAEVTERDGQIHQLQIANVQLKNQVDVLKVDLEAVNHKQQQAGEELATFKSNMARLTQQIRDAEQERKEREVFITSLKAEKEKIERDCSSSKRELQACSEQHVNEITRMRKLYEESSAKNTTQLAGEQQKLVKELSEKNFQVEASQRENDALKKKLQYMDGESERKDNEKKGLEIQMQDLTTKVRSKEKELNEKQLELQHAKRTAENNQTALESTQRSLNATHERTVQLERVKLQMQSQLDQLTQRKEEVERKLSKAEHATAEVALLRQELDLVNGEKRNREQELEHYKAELQLMKQQATDDAKDREIAKLKGQLEAANKRILDIQREVDGMFNNVEAAKAAAKESDKSVTKDKQIQKMMDKYPGRVPVKCQKAEGCKYPDLLKYKFAVHSEMSMQKFLNFIHGKLDLKETDTVSVQIITPSGSRLATVPMSTQLGDIHRDHQHEDMCLHVQYSY